MAELQKRFIITTQTKWDLITNKDIYNESIVFITNTTEGGVKEGVKIYTQGAEFNTKVQESDIKSIINSYIKKGDNVTFSQKTDEEGVAYLEISAPGTTTITATSTDLVQAKAVAGALTTPMSLEAEVAKRQDKLNETINYTTATFTQNFTDLKGDEVQAVSTVLVEGDNVKFSNAQETDGSAIGVKISADDTKYKMTSQSFTAPSDEDINEVEDYVSIDLHSGVNGEFGQINGFAGDAGDIRFKGGNGINISLSSEDTIKISANLDDLKTDINYVGQENNPVIVDNEKREIYHTTAAITKTTDGDTLSSDNKSFDVPTYTFDEFGHVSSEKLTTVTLPDTAFTDANTTYDLDVTANATKGVDINLKDNDDTTDTITLVGGSNVDVTLKDGKVEISSSYENDNTTYTGEKAIEVAQPEEGSTQGKVTLKINSDDKFLSQDDNGLKSTIEVKYDSATNYIYLEGSNGSTTGFDASAFVKDSFVESVAYVDQDDNGNTGKFLKFVFVIVDQDGQIEFDKTTTTTYVDVTELINTIYDVEGDSVTYSVVEESTKEDGTVLFTVKNTLGTISRDNSTNTITVSKAGLAAVGDIKTVLETIGSDLDAVKAEGSDKDEIAVVTGVTQVNGKITQVDSGLAATKTYVDTAISTAIQGLDAEVTSTDGTKIQVKVTEVDGKITAVNVTETDIASAQDLADLTAEVEENEEVTAEALADLNSRLEGINTTIENLDLGVTSVKASTTSDHVTVTPTTDTKGTVELTVDVASVDATDTTTYTATGLATDAYVNEKVASAEGSITLTNGDNGEYVFAEEKAGYVTAKHMAAIMNEAWSWGTI